MLYFGWRRKEDLVLSGDDVEPLSTAFMKRDVHVSLPCMTGNVILRCRLDGVGQLDRRISSFVWHFEFPKTLNAKENQVSRLALRVWGVIGALSQSIPLSAATPQGVR